MPYNYHNKIDEKIKKVEFYQALVDFESVGKLSPVEMMLRYSATTFASMIKKRNKKDLFEKEPFYVVLREKSENITLQW